MKSRLTPMIGSVLLGIVVGIVGYAGYRGDIAWSVPSSSDSPALEPEVAAAPPQRATPPKARPLPKIPVSLSHYENRQGRGYIVQVHNESQKHLAVLVELENPTLEQQQNAALQLAPGEVREIGQAQGWTFVSGETIRIKQKGYQTSSLTIP